MPKLFLVLSQEMPKRRFAVITTKTRAHSRASYLITKDKCEICGYGKNLVMHHVDYDYPLIVVTVCRSCHGHIHHDIGTFPAQFKKWCIK
jgi:ribosomal protein L37E